MDELTARLDLFRQMKTSIRGSENFLVVGMDVAKSNHHAFFGTPNGRTLRKDLAFDNSIASFDKVRALATELCRQHGLIDVVYGLEPTASYHKPLAEYLISQNEHVVYVSNVAVAKNRALLDGRWDKNDKKDAANVADLVGQGRCLFYDLPDDNLRELKSLIAFRSKQKREEHALRMRLRNNLLAQYFPEMDKYHPGRGQQDDVILSVAQYCLDPREIASMEFDAFLKIVSTRKMRIEQERRLRQLWEAAKVSAGCRAHDAAKWEAQSLVIKLKTARELIKENERRIQLLARQFPEHDSLMSIPGFGPVISAMVLAAIGNPFRFQNRKQVLRLAGLDLSAERSGKTSDSAKPVISKQGKAALRYALVQAATVAAALNADIRSYFSCLLKGREFERGINLKMKVKLASKLLIVAWTLMKTKEQFKSSCFKV